MALLLIDIQNLSGFFCQRRIDLLQTLCHIFMYRRLTDPKLLCSLPNRGIMFNDIFSDLFPRYNFSSVFLCDICFYNLCRVLHNYSISFPRSMHLHFCYSPLHLSTAADCFSLRHHMLSAMGSIHGSSTVRWNPPKRPHL